MIKRPFLSGILIFGAALMAGPSHAALAVISKTSGSSTTDAMSYATASITPSANSLILVAVWSRRSSGTVTNPTLSNSNGVTSWALEDTRVLNNRKLALFRGMTNSPSAGVITINFSETQTGCAWSIFEITGTDTSGTNGSGAIVQNPASTTGTGTSSSITLAAFGSPNNMAISVSSHDATTATTVGSGFTRIDDVSFSESAARLATQYKLNQTAVSDSWSASQSWGIMAVEVKAAVTVNYVASEGRFTGGGGNASSANYQAVETSFEPFSSAAMASTNYGLETKIGVGGAGIGVINSVSPSDFAKLYSDQSASYTIGAVSQDGDTLQYRVKQDSAIKAGPQSSNALSWSLTALDQGRHTMSLEVIDPHGTTQKKQEAYVVRRPTK